MSLPKLLDNRNVEPGIWYEQRATTENYLARLATIGYEVRVSTEDQKNTEDNKKLPQTMLDEFRRPFLSADTEFKVQTLGQGKSALCVAYVDARHVQERLNAVCQEFDAVWSNEYERPIIVQDDIKAVEAIIRIERNYKVEEDGQKYSRIATFEHSDVGSLDNVNEKHHGLKALYSDAFKRAAVHFGIAVSLYGLPQMWLPKEDQYLRIASNGKSAYMQKAGEELLREQLIKYLKEDSTITKFGLPRSP